jgi:methionyl-tRNA formyltransferase
MKTFLICHEDEILSREAMPRWLNSFSELSGILVIRENRKTLKKRIRREVKRTGKLRFLDVIAFRLYYRFFLQANDKSVEEETCKKLIAQNPPLPDTVPLLTVESPNSSEAADFIRLAQPDITIARCKSLLRKKVYDIPAQGTFVMHPGICPEYRNAHGCFWALANRDLANVGMTLLRIDEGIDTGPAFGYFRCDFDENSESHITIQNKTVFDNLSEIEERLLTIARGEAERIETTGRQSQNWGQPWLSSYLRWKQAAKMKK